MRDRLLMWTYGLIGLLVMPALALAQRRGEPEEEIYDARLLGYEQRVALEDSSTALTWLLLIFLAVLALGVLFKDARRTHLD
jgi:hypothetical protein